MAATIHLNEWNGTVGTQESTYKNGTTIRFKSADNAIVDNSNPMIRPNAGVYRSYEKWLRARIDDLDDATAISNVEVFTTGTPNAGISIWAATASAYCEDNGSPRIGGYSSANALPQPKTNLFAATSSDPIVLGEGPFDTNEADGDVEDTGIGDYLVLQMEVLPSAALGQTRSYSIILRYDEE